MSFKVHWAIKKNIYVSGCGFFHLRKNEIYDSWLKKTPYFFLYSRVLRQSVILWDIFLRNFSWVIKSLESKYHLTFFLADCLELRFLKKISGDVHFFQLHLEFEAQMLKSWSVLDVCSTSFSDDGKTNEDECDFGGTFCSVPCLGSFHRKA